MNYLAAIREKNAPRGTDKTDKTPIQGSSVSFGSTPQGTFAEKNEIVARVLPVVNGWPTAAGCPWCHVKTRQFPRPPVQSVTCKHYTPDQLNPPAGAGGYRCGTHYPREQHRCDEYEPQTAQHKRADHE